MTPTYLLMDRLVKYVIAGTAPAVQFAQGWIPADGPTNTVARARIVLSTVTVGAVLTALIFAWGADDAARVLSHGRANVGQPELALFSLLVGLLVLTQVNALAVLVPLGLDRLLAVSTAVGAIVLVLAGLAAAADASLPGILTVTLAVEGAILTTQLGGALHRRRTAL